MTDLPAIPLNTQPPSIYQFTRTMPEDRTPPGVPIVNPILSTDSIPQESQVRTSPDGETFVETLHPPFTGETIQTNIDLLINQGWKPIYISRPPHEMRSLMTVINEDLYSNPHFSSNERLEDMIRGVTVHLDNNDKRLIQLSHHSRLITFLLVGRGLDGSAIVNRGLGRMEGTIYSANILSKVINITKEDGSIIPHLTLVGITTHTAFDAGNINDPNSLFETIYGASFHRISYTACRIKILTIPLEINGLSDMSERNYREWLNNRLNLPRQLGNQTNWHVSEGLEGTLVTVFELQPLTVVTNREASSDGSTTFSTNPSEIRHYFNENNFFNVSVLLNSIF